MKKILALTVLSWVATAFAADTAKTLSVKFRNELIPSAATGVGSCIDIVRDNDFLYAIGNRTLTILSLQDPSQPRIVSTLPNVGNLRQIAIRDNIAYITARENGLFVIDISDRKSPKILSHYDTVEFATGIALKDNFAFIANRWFGVEIIDISDPAHLKHTAVVHVGEAQSCEVADGYLYAGAWVERRVAVCDVRNPADPEVVTNLQLDGRGDGVCVRNGILYAATGHHQPGSKETLDDPRYGYGNGMDIFDVSDPANAKLLSRIKLDIRFYGPVPDTWRVKLAFPYAYLIHTTNGIFVFDVSDPGNPKEIAQIRIPLYPNDKGYRRLNLSKTLHPAIMPFDPAEKCYSPVCGISLADGYMYIAGSFTDLHIFHDEKFVKPETPAAKENRPLKAVGNFHEPKGNLGLKNLKRYTPGTQVYAAVEQDGFIYAACGAGGIHVLDENLKNLAVCTNSDFTMDVQVKGDVLYAAEGFAGLGCYKRDGAKLQRVTAYVSRDPIKQIRITPDGKTIIAHAGGSSFETIDVSDWSKLRMLKKILGTGGLVYYRQMCNGFIDGKYLCGYWCAGRIFMADFSKGMPEFLPDVSKALQPDMEAGGYAPAGSCVLVTRQGGYSIFKPNTGNTDATVYKIAGGPAFYGKPTIRDNLLIAANRVTGDVTLVDISKLEEPKLIHQFTLTGNPDIPFIIKDHVLLPAGYQGLLKFDLK